MNFRVLALALVAGAFGAAAPSPLAAQTVISSVPYTITASGKYVLGANLVNSNGAENCLTVNASNVILDLNGFFLSGSGVNTATTRAVILVLNVSNVTIRNGTVANNGFGIYFNGGANSLNHRVEDVNVTRCYLGGVYFVEAAPGSLVRRNTFSQLGGYTGGPGQNVYAIYGNAGVRMERNSIGPMSPTGGGASVGIRGAPGAFSIRNTISGCTVGISESKYQNNLTFNCTTPFSFGIDAGGNN